MQLAVIMVDANVRVPLGFQQVTVLPKNALARFSSETRRVNDQSDPTESVAGQGVSVTLDEMATTNLLRKTNRMGQGLICITRAYG